jgi:hypothetical protein
MSLFDTAFLLLSTVLALYFSYVRFRAGMPRFGNAMVAATIFQAVFSLMGLDVFAYLSAAAFILLYMKSLTIIQAHGLSDGSVL